MDPITAFSLAGTILQLMGTGVKFTQLVQKIHNARDGSPRDSASELIFFTQKFVDVLKSFGSSANRESTDAVGPTDGLSLLADECIHITQLLLKQLRKAGFPEKPPTGRWETLKKALDMAINTKDLEKIRLRLNSCRDQFNTELLVSLRSVLARPQGRPWDQNLSRDASTNRRADTMPNKVFRNRKRPFKR